MSDGRAAGGEVRDVGVRVKPHGFFRVKREPDRRFGAKQGHDPT